MHWYSPSRRRRLSLILDICGRALSFKAKRTCNSRTAAIMPYTIHAYMHAIIVNAPVLAVIL